MVRIRAAVKV